MCSVNICGTRSVGTKLVKFVYNLKTDEKEHQPDEIKACASTSSLHFHYNNPSYVLCYPDGWSESAVVLGHKTRCLCTKRKAKRRPHRALICCYRCPFRTFRSTNGTQLPFCCPHFRCCSSPHIQSPDQTELERGLCVFDTLCAILKEDNTKTNIINSNL